MKNHFKKNRKGKNTWLFEDYKLIYGVGISCCVLLFVGLVHYLTASYNYNYMLKTEQQSLFLNTFDFFYECMQRAGGLLTYAGCFLTQFFYYPHLGSILYIVLLLLIVILTLKAFRMPWHFYPLAFLPAFMLLLSYTQLGYLIFVLKSPGYVFANPLGVAVSIGAFWAYRSQDNWYIRCGFVGLLIVFTYPLFGFYTLFGGLLCLLYEIILCVRTNKEGSIYPVLMALVSMIAVPYLYFMGIYTRMLENDLYVSALPRFYFTESELSLWMPFVFIILFLLLFLALPFLELGPKKKNWCAGICFLLFGICAWKVYQSSYMDENFRTELEMDLAISEGDWNRVLQAASHQKGEPTRLIVLNTHLALQKLGLAGDQLFQYTNGSKPYDVPRLAPYLRILGARPLYYQYGALNFSYRWSMEDAVENGWRVDYLKTMAKCALLNSEYALARKYLSALKHTWFHKDWATHFERYADDPRQISQNEEFAAIQPYTGFSDLLDGDGGLVEIYLLNNFAHMEGGSPELVEVSLQSNLILKNIERFWPRFFHYIRMNERIPVHYQEAALLYSYLEQRVDVSGLNLDPHLIKRFNELIRLSQELANRGEEYCKIALKPLYGDTFWYYYFFVKGLRTS